MTDREVNLEITATDDASAKLEQVADSAEAVPSEVEVDVEADTRAAETRIERFAREVEDLDGDAREIRFEFRGQQLEREIRTALRALERLEDPIEIEAASRDLERAQAELRDLAALADEKYSIDIDADPKRTAQRAAGDIDSMRQRGEGLQSAIPALRGFGDELGGSAQAAGIAGQAVADLGDFSLIMGEKFGISESASAKLGTALGAAGLLAVGVGIALPLLQSLAGGAGKVAEETEGASEALDDFYGSMKRLQDEALSTDPILAALFADEDDETLKRIAIGFNEVGLGIGDIREVAIEADRDAEALFTTLASNTGVTDEAAAAIGNLVAEGKPAGATMVALEQVIATLGTSGSEANSQIRGTAETLIMLRDEMSAELDASITDELKAAAFAGDELAATLLGEVLAGTRSAVSAADDLAASHAALEDETKRAEVAADRQAAATERQAQAAADAAEALRDQADASLEAAGAARDLAGAQLDETAAIDQWNVTLFESTAALGDLEQGSAEYNTTLKTTTESAVSMADATVATAQAAAEAEGRQLAASDSTSAWNASMAGAARQASGPLRDSIIDYIATVNGIEPEKVTDILADTDYATVAEAGAALDGVSVTREAQVVAEAITYDADAELDRLAATRYARIIAISGGPITGSPGGDQSGRSSLGAPIEALGRNAEGEIIFASSSGSSGSSGSSITGGDVSNTSVIVNLPRAASGRDVVREVERWSRVNGRR